MNATLIPTKTAGDRPPILPPVHTTFDGSMGDGDSWITHLADDVRMICRHADAASAEGLETMIGVLQTRKRLVVMETLAQHATEDYPLPPILDFAIDYLTSSSTREERILHGLLVQIEECQARCERRLARHRFELRLLRDLGASDS